MKRIISKERAGKILILPEIGKVEIPSDGVLELEDHLAKVLVESNIGWKYEEGSMEDEENEEIDFSKLNLEELVKLASDAGYPQEEFAKYSHNKKLMEKYLKKKLKG